MGIPQALRPAAALLALAAFAGRSGAAALPPGVAGDGKTDDTAAIQAALNEAGKSGGEVSLPAGAYMLKGSLTVPTGVTLSGSWQAPHHGAWDKGTTLLVTAGRGREDGPAAITLQQSSAVRGVTLIWPEQKADNIVPYPWAIHGSGMHDTVENVTLVNAYQGVKIGQPWSELHLIRNVFGCVLRRGIFIDQTSDVGRIENVHFNTHYWPRSGYPAIQIPGGDAGRGATQFAQKNLEAFIFGRTDWEYVANTFVWGARVGYRFIKTADGACNGQFMGIGADACGIGILVDQIQNIGIQVTNAEVTAFAGGENAGIVISPGASGAAQFVNCNFWSTPGGAVQVHGDTQVTLNACHFVDPSPNGVVQADRGRLVVNGCTFAATGKAVVLKQGARSAMIVGNSQPGGLSVENGIGANAQMGLNETAHTYPPEMAGHYLVRIGTPGDEEILGPGWYGGEGSDSGDAAGATERFRTARWTTGDGTLRLPVRSGEAYTLTVWLLTRPNTPPAAIVAPGAKAPVAVGKNQRVQLSIPASATRGQPTIEVKIAGAPWSPSKMWPGNNDNRNLGARVFAVEMKSARGPAKATPLN